MDKIIEIAIIILLIFLVGLLCYYVHKRISGIRKINTLKKTARAKITKNRSPFASFFKLSKKPDLIIEIGKRIYFARLINGRGSHRFMHFASERFFVTYSKMRFSLGSLTNFRTRRAVTRTPGFLTTGAHSVKVLPKLNIPEEYIRKRDIYGKMLEPVLILNPAPNELSYVTESKSSIKVAFTGDEVFGQKIFTASSFASYAERVCREDTIYGN